MEDLCRISDNFQIMTSSSSWLTYSVPNGGYTLSIFREDVTAE